MENGAFFMWRCVNSILSQTFTDYEIIFTKKGKMAENTNAAIRAARGELIKVLYLDDYFAHPEALQRIVDAFTENDDWLVTGCEHDDGDGNRFSPHVPELQGIFSDQNSIGSPSVLTIRRGLDIWFDENMSWLLDVDFYKRVYATHRDPVILDDINIVIGVGKHQTTHILTDKEKFNEEVYLKNKKHV